MDSSFDRVTVSTNGNFYSLRPAFTPTGPWRHPSWRGCAAARSRCWPPPLSAEAELNGGPIQSLRGVVQHPPVLIMRWVAVHKPVKMMATDRELVEVLGRVSDRAGLCQPKLSCAVIPAHLAWPYGQIDQPVALLRQLAGSHPDCRDDVREVPAVPAEGGRPAGRTRHRHLPRNRPALVEPVRSNFRRRSAGSGSRRCVPSPTGGGTSTRST